MLCALCSHGSFAACPRLAPGQRLPARAAWEPPPQAARQAHNEHRPAAGAATPAVRRPCADAVLGAEFVSDSLCFGTRTRQCRRIKIDRNKKQTATRFTIRDTEPRNTHRTADYFTHAEITGREAHTQRECRCLDGASTYVSFQALEQEFSEWGKDYHESDAVAIEMKAGQVRAHKSSESRIRESENLLQQR